MAILVSLSCHKHEQYRHFYLWKNGDLIDYQNPYEMNSTDFVRLNGLISKLNHEVNHVAQEDDCFRKYYQQSAEALREAQRHLRKIENGLKAAKYLTT